jgi:hypothetical protein
MHLIIFIVVLIKLDALGSIAVIITNHLVKEDF